jgi:hypothetical protein
MNTNIDYSRSKLHTLLSIRGGDKLLTPEEIAQLNDNDIVFVQWPCEEGATPYRIKTKPLEGYDRPWVYATDIHPYRDGPCLWQREISGFGQFTPGNTPYDLRVWQIELPDMIPMAEETDMEVFQTIQW